MRINKRVVAIVSSVVAASVLIVALGYAGFFNSSSFTGTTVHFTIIETNSGPLEGINGSYYHPLPPGPPWPVMTVDHGERVIIHVINNGTEPHGFAIIHYFSAGVAISEGQSYDVSFIANQIGNFTVFCRIECSIHPFMQNGLLIVR